MIRFHSNFSRFVGFSSPGSLCSLLSWTIRLNPFFTSSGSIEYGIIVKAVSAVVMACASRIMPNTQDIMPTGVRLRVR